MSTINIKLNDPVSFDMQFVTIAEQLHLTIMGVGAFPVPAHLLQKVEDLAKGEGDKLNTELIMAGLLMTMLRKEE